MKGSELKAYLDGQETEMLQLLRDLVNIDSGTYCKAGIDAVGGIMASKLAKLGFATETVLQAESGNHVLARRPGNSGKKLLLLAHLDTVFPAGWAARNPFQIRNGRATGPGVLDMKSCLVAALYALQALAAVGNGQLPEICLLMVGDEELGSVTARSLIEAEGRKADWVLVVEAARVNGAVVTERKGIGYLDISARGRAAHAGIEPEVGRNAIEELAMKIVKLRQLNDFAAGTTVTIGQIAGGEARNVVAEEAEVKVDLRFRTEAAARNLFAAIEAVLASPEIPGVQLNYTLKLNRPPLVQVPGSEVLLAVTATASAELGIPLTTAVTGGGSDGNFTAALGIPTLDGLGPVGGYMCTPEEYLEIGSLTERTARLALIIARLGEL
jgi:glutamate carboxypeptidase